MMAQPSSRGMRQPQAVISGAGDTNVSATPSSAANITATCWLADCQLT